MSFLYRGRTCSHIVGHPTDTHQENTPCSLWTCCCTLAWSLIRSYKYDATGSKKQKNSEVLTGFVSVLLLLSLNHQHFLFCYQIGVFICFGQMFTLADILVPLLATVEVVGTVLLLQAHYSVLPSSATPRGSFLLFRSSVLVINVWASGPVDTELRVIAVAPCDFLLLHTLCGSGQTWEMGPQVMS